MAVGASSGLEELFNRLTSRLSLYSVSSIHAILGISKPLLENTSDRKICVSRWSQIRHGYYCWQVRNHLNILLMPASSPILHGTRWFDKLCLAVLEKIMASDIYSELRFLVDLSSFCRHQLAVILQLYKSHLFLLELLVSFTFFYPPIVCLHC